MDSFIQGTRSKPLNHWYDVLAASVLKMDQNNLTRLIIHQIGYLAANRSDDSDKTPIQVNVSSLFRTGSSLRLADRALGVTAQEYARLMSY